MADELIDIYDENMNLLGTAMTSQVYREGLWHFAFHCWLSRKTENGKIVVWLQHRNKDKDVCPGKFDVSVAGLVKAGEEVKNGYREIIEELGIHVEKNDLEKLFTFKEVITADGLNNREFDAVYMGKLNRTLDDVVLQPEGVAGVYEVELDDMLNLLKHKVSFIPSVGLRRQDDNSCVKDTRSIRWEEMCPHSEPYYLKAMEAIRRSYSAA